MTASTSGFCKCGVHVRRATRPPGDRLSAVDSACAPAGAESVGRAGHLKVADLPDHRTREIEIRRWSS